MISKSETAITKNWVLNSEPVVSIICVTYNHEKFIEMALDSFLTQDTKFQFEIIVRDDGSTDGTATIIKRYVKKYPNIIKPIYETENQFSKGIDPMPVVYEKANGVFFALCEGDDYWIEPAKLQRQFNFLKNNSEYSATADNAWVEFESGKKIPFSRKAERDISLKELSISRQCATSGLMFRAFDQYPEVIKGFLFGDTPLIMYLAKRGKVRYFEQVSSVYRRHSGGLTNQIGKSSSYTEKIVSYNQQLNDLLDTEFSRTFNLRIAKVYFNYSAFCFPSNVRDSIKYFLKAIKHDPGASFVFFLRRFLLFDKVVGKLASRFGTQQVFMK